MEPYQDYIKGQKSAKNLALRHQFQNDNKGLLPTVQRNKDGNRLYVHNYLTQSLKDDTTEDFYSNFATPLEQTKLTPLTSKRVLPEPG